MSSVALLSAVLSTACGDVDVHATSQISPSVGEATWTEHFREDFDGLDNAIWRCEYACPNAENGKATFSLMPQEEPNTDGSWSKIKYLPQRFTSGAFSIRFALSSRPAEPVWWGMALWDAGPTEDESEYNEINVGYTTDGDFQNTELRFLSARLGEIVSYRVDTKKNLYDGSFHTMKLVYEASRVALYFDGELLQTITDARVIPSAPLSLIVGARLKRSPALASRFDHVIDSCEIDW